MRQQHFMKWTTVFYYWYVCEIKEPFFAQNRNVQKLQASRAGWIWLSALVQPLAGLATTVRLQPSGTAH